MTRGGERWLAQAVGGAQELKHSLWAGVHRGCAAAAAAAAQSKAAHE
jgi:hypothetical protein